jgi:hypothetical protein
LKAILFAVLVAAAAVALAASDAAAHHGKKEEHAQPAAARGGCTWTRAGKAYTSLADCMKGGQAKRSCRSACK